MDASSILPVVLASTVLSAMVAGGISLLGQWLNLRHQAGEAKARAQDLTRQRVRENSEFMMSLIAIAHGSPSDGRQNLAVGEQLAAIELIVANANEYPELVPATDVFLMKFIGHATQKASSGSIQAITMWKELATQARTAHDRLVKN